MGRGALFSAIILPRTAMQNPEDLEEIQAVLSEAADLLLPLAYASTWPARLDVIAWLIAIRDSFKNKDGHLH